jgi:DNA-binding transcriptional ArsR family regulator
MYANRTERDVGKGAISVKVAVYPESGEPEVSEVSAASPRAASIKFLQLVMEKVNGAEGRVPEESLRELIQNLIHADFRGVVISVFESGNVVRVSDKGPGIGQKARAFEFGFSGATPEAAQEIRGVGAGLGIARAAAEKVGGTVTIEDNIGGGTVATVSVGEAAHATGNGKPASRSSSQRKYPDAVPRMDISERQQKVLITVLECGEIGPSTVAERLEMSVSTAYRDLSVLEEHGLVSSAESGKRAVTPLGQDLVEAIIRSWVK